MPASYVSAYCAHTASFRVFMKLDQKRVAAFSALLCTAALGGFCQSSYAETSALERLDQLLRSAVDGATRLKGYVESRFTERKSSQAEAIGTVEVREYLRASGIVAAGTDAILDGLLAQKSTVGDVSWLAVFQLLVVADKTASMLARRDYQAAILAASEYASIKALESTAVGSAFAAACAIAGLGSLPIELGLKDFARAATNAGLKTQVQRYLDARKAGVSYAAILDRKGGDEILFDDEGWIVVVGDARGTTYRGWQPPAGYTPQNVFRLAEGIYQATQKQEAFEAEKHRIFAEFNRLVDERLNAKPAVIATKPRSGARTSRDALLAEFREPNGSSEVIWSGAKFSIELCDQDGICSYYEGRATKSEAEVWDLAFLQSYYVEETLEGFKAAHKDLAPALLAQYAALCPTSPDSAVAARCIVDRLSKRNGVRMGGVRYDEGHHCVVWTDREFDPDRDCKPY